MECNYIQQLYIDQHLSTLIISKICTNDLYISNFSNCRSNSCAHRGKSVRQQSGGFRRGGEREGEKTGGAGGAGDTPSKEIRSQTCGDKRCCGAGQKVGNNTCGRGRLSGAGQEVGNKAFCGHWGCCNRWSCRRGCCCIR